MPRVFQLRKELSAISQGNMTITSYFTKFRTLVAEIDNLNPMPKCICVTRTCLCQNAQKLEKYEDMIKLSQFLMRLTDQYTAIRGQLLMMQPIPTITQAFSLLLKRNHRENVQNSLILLSLLLKTWL